MPAGKEIPKRPAGHPSVQSNSGVDRSLSQLVGHLACIHIDRSGQSKSSPQMQARTFTAAHVRPWTRKILISRSQSSHCETKEQQRKEEFSPTQHDMVIAYPRKNRGRRLASSLCSDTSSLSPSDFCSDLPNADLISHDEVLRLSCLVGQFCSAVDVYHSSLHIEISTAQILLDGI